MFFGTKYPIFGKFLFLRNLCLRPNVYVANIRRGCDWMAAFIECTNLCLQDEDQARNQI